MMQRQKGSQVEEGELERLTMRGKGPKQHALPGWNRRKGGIQSHPRPARQASSRLQPGQRSQLSRMNGSPADLVLGCVVVIFVYCAFMCVLQFQNSFQTNVLRGKAHTNRHTNTHTYNCRGEGQSPDDAAGNDGTLISPSLATDPGPNLGFSPSLISFHAWPPGFRRLHHFPPESCLLCLFPETPVYFPRRHPPSMCPFVPLRQCLDKTSQTTCQAQTLKDRCHLRASQPTDEPKKKTCSVSLIASRRGISTTFSHCKLTI